MSASGAVLDLREEMDTGVATATPKVEGKAKFLIRTLPRECNPTPVSQTANANSLSPSPSSTALSPASKRPRTPAVVANLSIQELDNPFDDITEEKLQKLSGRQDLSRVTSLRISVDSSKQSVEVLGELLPSLQQLVLENSSIFSFRDLGTSLHSLQTLTISRSSITDLDGISALTCLQELYVQYNQIADITPLSMHEDLQVVDLEGNSVADIGQIEQLAFCHQLTKLNLVGNPVCNIDRYRQIVANFVPQLTILDGQLVSDADRASISEEEVMAAIHDHLANLRSDCTLMASPSTSSTSRLPSLSGDVLSISTSSLSRSASVKRIESSTFDVDDSGSSLTHGTDIVFAGNVTSALRRHRSESEADSTIPVDSPIYTPETEDSLHASRPSTPARAGVERPKTPAARVSITDTLDRAHQLESQCLHSRDSIMSELRAWQLESAGASVLGVTFGDQDMGRPESPTLPRGSQRRGSVTIPSSGGMLVSPPSGTRRPNTSAGLVRDGWAVREAFTTERPCSRNSRSQTPPTKQRHSASGSSSAPAVDILILDDSGPGDDDDDAKRPCSPVKTPRGVYAPTSMDGRYRQWNVNALSPAIDTSNARQFLPTSLSVKEQQQRVFQHARNRRLAEEDENSDESEESDGDDHQEKQVVKSKHQEVPLHAGFFNIAASLDAIDKWRDQEDDEANEDDGSSESRSSRRRRSGTSNSTGSKLASIKVIGPANELSDDEIVRRLKSKDVSVAETKTREGFRRFFAGIHPERLEGVLQRVFADQDKVRRRMELMCGFFADCS